MASPENMSIHETDFQQTITQHKAKTSSLVLGRSNFIFNQSPNIFIWVFSGKEGQIL